MLDFIEKPAKSGRNRYLMFLLHGYYGNGENIMGLANYFADISDDICFIAPNAPEKIADDGYQWFPLDAECITPESVSKSVAVNHWIFHDFLKKQIEELSMDYSNVFLVGFSQGAMVALYTGVRLDARIGGIVSFSGLQPDCADNIKSSWKTEQRILMLHSANDTVVPYECLSYSQNLLKSFGLEITVHTCRNNAGHCIDQDCIAAAKGFLDKIINNRS
ncbi:MAG: hypothetical protein LBI70_03190 [Rickettsiales bacterium]|jgi:phospholipase/carboxylesterase|nr:hypothetical protein [Rickettsiales bacterium]